MKPFDLEAAKRGEPVQTRDGKPARIICYDVKNAAYPLVALIDDGRSETLHPNYGDDGRQPNKYEPLDLFMAPIQREGWAIMDADEELYSTVFRTPEEARRIVKKCEMSECSIVKMMWDE